MLQRSNLSRNDSCTNSDSVSVQFSCVLYIHLLVPVDCVLYGSRGLPMAFP